MGPEAKTETYKNDLCHICHQMITWEQERTEKQPLLIQMYVLGGRSKEGSLSCL